MPLYMDVHRNMNGITPDSLRAAHFQDLDVEERFGVHYHKYFFNEATGTVFCLVEGPSAEACRAVHRESHGLEPEDIIEVQPEVVEAFFAAQRYDDVGAAIGSDGRPDGALRVVMFTEVANLAVAARSDERRAAAVLAAHDRIVRESVVAQGGHEVQHTGEGIMACFQSVSAALRAARHIQRRSHRTAADAPRIRIGMSAGEPVAQDRALFGAAVNVARRICDAAQPGEILVSAALRELGMGKGDRFESVGPRTLKDDDQPHVLYAVPWRRPGSDADQPAVRRLVDRLRRFGEELRRRRVVKALVGYTIVLIGVLQAAELTLEPLGLPDWSYELVLTLGLLGFPVVLVLAWAFDVTPRGLERAPSGD